jgi:hypothetical protein
VAIESRSSEIGIGAILAARIAESAFLGICTGRGDLLSKQTFSAAMRVRSATIASIRARRCTSKFMGLKIEKIGD